MEQSQVTDSTPSTHFAGQNPFELTRPGDGPRDLRDLIQERSHLWDGKTPTSAHRTCFQSAPSPRTCFHRPTKLAALEFKRTGHFALLSSLSQKHWAQLPPTCLCPHLLYPAAPRKHTSFSLLHTHTLTHSPIPRANRWEQSSNQHGCEYICTLLSWPHHLFSSF